MTERVRNLLRAFEALSPNEQQQAAAEMLGRSGAVGVWLPPEVERVAVPLLLLKFNVPPVPD